MSAVSRVPTITGGGDTAASIQLLWNEIQKLRAEVEAPRQIVPPAVTPAPAAESAQLLALSSQLTVVKESLHRRELDLTASEERAESLLAKQQEGQKKMDSYVEALGQRDNKIEALLKREQKQEQHLLSLSERLHVLEFQASVSAQRNGTLSDLPPPEPAEARQDDDWVIPTPDVVAITEGFVESRKIGEYPFGTMYKARYAGTLTSVTVLSQAVASLEDAAPTLTLLTFVGRTHLENHQPCYLFALSTQGTLRSRLDQQSRPGALPLLWNTRLKIAWECALVLRFLQQCVPDPPARKFLLQLGSNSIFLDNDCDVRLFPLGFLDTLLPGSDQQSLSLPSFSFHSRP